MEAKRGMSTGKNHFPKIKLEKVYLGETLEIACGEAPTLLAVMTQQQVNLYL
jgi:chemotaxis protein CheY-P-specific phosphatase CheC